MVKITRQTGQAIILTLVVLGSVWVTNITRRPYNSEEPMEKPPASFNQAISATAFNRANDGALAVSFTEPPFVSQREREVFAPPSPFPTIKEGIAFPFIGASAVLTIDLESGFDFYSQGNSKRWPIASLTKLMTAVIAKEQVGEEKTVVMSEAAVATEGNGGGFQTGQRFSVKDLIKAMMIVSSNDAASAIAEFYGADRFIEAMNKKAKELAMSQTDFSDPTGLSVLNQSSLGDLRKLATYILNRYPDLLAITTEPKSVIRDLNSSSTEISLTNINKFAKSERDFIGGKTGYIEEARQNLLSIFKINNRPVMITVLGSRDRFGETAKLLKWIRNAYRF